MKKFLLRVYVTTCAIFLIQSVSAQIKTNTTILKQASIQQAEKERILFERIQTLAREKKWDLVIRRPNGGIAILTDIDGFGNPVYTSTENNILAAATIGTNKLWPGGVTGLSLSGSSNNVKSKLAVWDGGRVRGTHVELTGRVLQKDNPANIEDHSTHVAGTLIASGVNPLAKGMSFGQQQLIAYDFLSDASEMLNESPNLLISNHSYGSLSGWEFNNNRWEFYGPVGSTEDYQLGYYSTTAQLWDSIAYNAPNYLIVKSAGNKRDENGPAVGETYWRRNAGGTFISGPRPAGISNNDSYDIIPTYGTSKNILTIGAINPLSAGYSRPQDVVMSSFSSWGPTDDGRIKPDVVADGVGVLSSIGTSDNAYDIYDGTSMASPNAAGSLLLLQEYYNQLHPGNFMRSATLKGLIIHTADEAGPAPGPDYQFGWGLINMQKAAAVITANNSTHVIQENILNNGSPASFNVVASGNGTISATLSWTDPKAQVEPVASALNNPNKKLVDDLDIVIKKGATTYSPWVLSPFVPSADATQGNNSLDNVEKVELPNVVPGDTYTIEITHKGVLERGLQAYSVIVSGVGGTAYCASNATSNAGARIDSVSFAAIQKKNTAGCTTYSNYTALAGGNVEPGQSVPLFVRLNSCDATNVDKIVKVYIDANNDGDFIDAGETLATSAVINGNGDFSTNVAIPPGLTPGKYTILRIVMQETNVPAGVNPCGTYIRGETQDYRVFVATPTTDVGITELVSPNPTDCGLASQYITVRINNFGSQAKSNIPVSVVVKQGATTIATINGNYPGLLAAGSNTTFTLQTPFTSTGGATYTITSSTTLLGDQATANNQNVNTVVIKANSANPVGTAVVCPTTSNTLLQATVTGSEVFTWYTSLAATTPIASGSNTSTTIVASPYYLGKNDVSQHFGPVNKMAFADGGYLQFDANNQLRAIFTTSVPMTIETARMYVGESGTVLFRLAKLNTAFNYVTGAVDGFYFSNHPVDVYATAPVTPVPSTQVNDPADLGAIYHLGIDVPEAGIWALILETTGTASLFRNNLIPVGATNYPYVIPGIINLEGNGAVDNTDPAYNKKFYYFFYDMTVKLNSCPSPRVAIVPTTATAPTISIVGNVITSSSATGNQWYNNGVLIPGEVGQTYTALADGNYTTQVNTGGCVMSSNTIVFTVTAIPNVDPTKIGLVVSPVPAREQFRVQFDTRTKADLDISLVSISGQSVYHSATTGFIGHYSEVVTTGKIAAGVYYLRVIHDRKMYIRKVVIVQ